jgi:hypothetical protein
VILSEVPIRPPRAQQSRLRAVRRWAVGLSLLVLAAPLATSARAQRVHEDAVPQGVPPGFEPVDVSREVEEIQARKVRELERQAEVDMDYRYASPERYIRTRYGGATWNLYEPFH